MHTQYLSLLTAFMLSLPGQELRRHFSLWTVSLGVVMVVGGGVQLLLFPRPWIYGKRTISTMHLRQLTVIGRGRSSKISWFVDGEQINYLPKPNTDTDKSRYTDITRPPRPITVLSIDHQAQGGDLPFSCKGAGTLIMLERILFTIKHIYASCSSHLKYNI